MDCFMNAGNKIKLIFVAQILSVVSIAALAIPILYFPVLLKAASFLLLLVSLYSTGFGYQKFAGADVYASSPIPKQFRSAFVLSIVDLLAILLSNLLQRNGIHTPLPIVTAGLPILVTYYILSATANVLKETGDDDQAGKKPLFWKYYLICMLVAVICITFTCFPLFGTLTWICYILSKIMQAIADLIYLAYLYGAIFPIIGRPWK